MSHLQFGPFYPLSAFAMSAEACQSDQTRLARNFEPEISESVEQSFWFLILRSLCTTAYAGSILAGFTFLFLLALIAFSRRGQQVAFWPVFAMPVFAFAFAFISLPWILFFCWYWRPKVISATREHFVVETRFKTVKYPWESCTWSVASTLPFETAGAYPPGRSRIIVTYLPLKSGQPKQGWVFACGHTDESFSQWSAWLTSNGVERLSTTPKSTLFFRLAAPSTAGGVIGMTASFLLEPVIGPKAGMFWGLLGWLDGLMLGLCWHFLRSAGSKRLERATYLSREGLAACAIGFAKIGLLTGVANGWLSALVWFIANGAAGSVLVLMLAKRFGALEPKTD